MDFYDRVYHIQAVGYYTLSYTLYIRAKKYRDTRRADLFHLSGYYNPQHIQLSSGVDLTGLLLTTAVGETRKQGAALKNWYMWCLSEHQVYRKLAPE